MARWMKLLAGATLAVAVPASLSASIETPEAKAQAAGAAEVAREDMFAAFGTRLLEPGKYLWRDVEATGPARVIVSLTEQRAYLYRGDTLVAVSTISSGTPDRPTPTGIFTVLEKKPMHRSRKYDNAPMPHMQRIDTYGIALHAGKLPGYPASHGCIRLPAKFAAKLYGETRIGSTVMIGA